MRCCVCSIAWRIDRKSYVGPNLALPWAELLPLARSMGYEGVEVWEPHVAHLDDAGLAELRAGFAAHGLAAPMLSGYFNFTKSPESAVSSLANGRRVLARARALGIGMIRIFTGNHRSRDADEEQWARAADALRTLCDEAAPDGITLAAEIHDWNLVDSVEGCERLIALIDRPNFGLIFHPSHFSPDPLPALERLLPHVRHLHATNPPATLADGAIDYPRLLAALDRLGYAGWLSVEYFGDDPAGRCRREAEFLAAQLRALPGAGAGDGSRR